MNEARILCLCNSYKIPDLGIQLLRNEIAWVSEEKARNSRDLLQAINIKAVSVLWVKRCEKVQEPPKVIPPFVANYKPAPRLESKSYTQEEIEIIVRTQLEAILSEMLGPVMILIQKMGGDFVEQARETNLQLAEIARILKERPGVSVAVGSGKSEIAGYTESSVLFIPTNLVPNVSGTVSVDVQEGDGDSLEESLKQLRAQKKKQQDGES